MSSRAAVVLACVLQLMRPIVRLLLRHGVAYPAFASALKQVFIDAAMSDLHASGRKQTDSAVSLLSGVHRRDVRTLTRLAPERVVVDESPMNMATQVVARWLEEASDEEGTPHALARSGPAPSFEALVASISSDIRPRAVLDELVRLGLAEAGGDEVRLAASGFAPRQGFEEMARLLRDNLHDHLAAATLNLEGKHNYLEQAVFVDEITAESAHRLHVVSARAWRQSFRTVMAEARSRHAHDQAHAPADKRVHRVRFGSYFYAADDDERPT